MRYEALKWRVATSVTLQSGIARKLGVPVRFYPTASIKPKLQQRWRDTDLDTHPVPGCCCAQTAENRELQPRAAGLQGRVPIYIYIRVVIREL